MTVEIYCFIAQGSLLDIGQPRWKYGTVLPQKGTVAHLGHHVFIPIDPMLKDAPKKGVTVC